MRINEDTVLRGPRIALIPYLEEHVETYHAWMQDAVLRDLTASELLTLEEEYAMQRSWHEDEEKLTFIVVDHVSKPGNDLLTFKTCKMVGDVNCFMGQSEDGEGMGEIELMIAEEQYRGRGIGKEILDLFLPYLHETLDLCLFSAKISSRNAQSINLFRSLGFRDHNFARVFDELELRLRFPS